MRKNYFKRYVWLLDLLYRHGPLSLSEIQDYWSRSSINESGDPMAPRTFHNNRNSISETFGIDIDCDLSTSKYYIANADEINTSRFKQWMLDILSLNNLLDEYSSIRHQVVFEKIPSASQNLEPILRAIKQNVSITMDYQGFSMDQPKNIEVEPWFLKLFKQRWYLIGFSRYTNAERLYMLERAENITLTENKFILPEQAYEEMEYDRYFGVRPPEQIKIETVKLRVSAKQRKFLERLPIHASQKELEHTEEYSIYSLRLAINFDLEQEILSYGPEIEVISPEHLRTSIIEKLKITLSNY